MYTVDLASVSAWLTSKQRDSCDEYVDLELSAGVTSRSAAVVIVGIKYVVFHQSLSHEEA